MSLFISPEKKGEESHRFVYKDNENGSYVIESNNPLILKELKFCRSQEHNAIVYQVPKANSLSFLLKILEKGDVLIAINDELIIQQPFKLILSKFKKLIKSKRDYKLVFFRAKPDLSFDQFITNNYRKEFTDFYGFHCSEEDYHKHHQVLLSTTPASQITDQEWIRYFKSIGGIRNIKPAGIFSPDEKLKYLVRKGIPVAFRSAVWPRISLSIVYRLQFPKDYYQKLLVRAETELSEEVRDDIEKDLQRTFPNHPDFVEGSSELERVLKAFAIHHVSIGYCQSLNFIVGAMLLFLSEEESFWLLLTLVDKLLPPDYYSRTMIGVNVDQLILMQMVKLYLPNIFNHFEKHGLQLHFYTLNWFLCLFIGVFPLEVTLRIWDMLFNEGNKVIFRITLALLKIHEKEILKINDAVELFEFFKTFEKSFYNVDLLFSVAYKDFTTGIASKIPIFDGFKLFRTSNGGTSISSPPGTESSRASFGSEKKMKKKIDEVPSIRKVPRQLSGLGVGHIGTMERWTSMRYAPTVDLDKTPWGGKSSELSQTANEYDEKTLKEAKRLSDDLLSPVNPEVMELFCKSLEDDEDDNENDNDNNNQDCLVEESERNWFEDSDISEASDENDDDEQQQLTDASDGINNRLSKCSDHSTDTTERLSNDMIMGIPDNTNKPFQSPSLFSSESFQDTRNSLLLKTENSITFRPTSETIDTNTYLIRQSDFNMKFQDQFQQNKKDKAKFKKQNRRKSSIINFSFLSDITSSCTNSSLSSSSSSSAHYFTFKRKDIQNWRNLFRPIVERRVELRKKAMEEFQKQRDLKIALYSRTTEN